MTAPNSPSGQPAPAAQPAVPPAPAPAPAGGQPPAGPSPAQPAPAGGAQPSTLPASQVPPLSDQHAQALLADAVRRANAANAAAVKEHGYPDNTPVTAMPPEQQAAYWRHYARKHEERVKQMGDYEQLQAKARELDALVEASKTEQERAVDAARKQAREAALAEVGGQLVEAHVRVAAAGRASDEALSVLLDGLDKSRFLTADGKVDAGRVSTWVNTVLPPAAPPAAPAAAVPAPTPPPDMGQGRRTTTAPSGLAAGAAEARARLGLDKKTPAQ